MCLLSSFPFPLSLSLSTFLYSKVFNKNFLWPYFFYHILPLSPYDVRIDHIINLAQDEIFGYNGQKCRRERRVGGEEGRSVFFSSLPTPTFHNCSFCRIKDEGKKGYSFFHGKMSFFIWKCKSLLLLDDLEIGNFYRTADFEAIV